MLTDDSNQDPAGRLPVRDHLGAILGRFEDEWRKGNSPHIDKYIEHHAAEFYENDVQRLLAGLVEVDIWHRWNLAASQSTGGEEAEPPPTTAYGPPNDDLPVRALLRDYCAKYPHLGSARHLPAELVAQEYLVRCLWGDKPSRATFEAEYRTGDAELRAELDAMDADIKKHHETWDDDDSLAAEASKGDVAALKILLVRQHDHLFRHIDQRIPEASREMLMARDVLQAAQIEVFRSAGRIPGKVRDFRKWIEAVADTLLHLAVQACRGKNLDDTAQTPKIEV